MNLNTERFTRVLGRQMLVVKKNSPHILFAGGVIGIVASTVLACRATLKMEKNVDEIKGDFESIKELHSSVEEDTPYNKHEYYRDLSHVYFKSSAKVIRLYGPSVAIGVVSIAALTGSHVQLARRNAALTATLSLVSQAFEEYRERVREQVGEERELDIYRGTTKEIMEIDGKKQNVLVKGAHGLSPYARCFDEYSVSWKRDAELNRIFINCQEHYANHLLRSRGHIFLNEVYDSLGLERSPAGAVVGWLWNSEGDNYVDFGLFETINERFLEGKEYSIWLDFNVDGIIYDKI
jgi:Family of unknown function (DUF6353)